MIETSEERCRHEHGTEVEYWHFEEGQKPQMAVSGVVEIIHENSVHPSFAGWSRANLGEKVVRLLDHEGNPSPIYERIHRPPVAPGEPLRWRKKRPISTPVSQ